MADEPAPVKDAPADPPKVDEPIKQDDDWQAKARKHERDLKKERTAREAAEAKLAEHDDAAKSEQEKAIDKARKEAAAEAETKVSSSYKARILNAEIRAQAAGKFANPKLATRLLDLDADALFDDEGEVDAKAIAAAVDEFLKQDENAGLRANGTRPAAGDSDAGKGSGAASGDMNDWVRDGIRK